MDRYTNRYSRRLASVVILLGLAVCRPSWSEERSGEEPLEVREYPVTDILADLREEGLAESLANLRALSIAAGAPTDVMVRRASDEGLWRLKLTAKQHAKFSDLLDGLRRGGTRQVVLTAQWFDMPNLDLLRHVDLSKATRFPSPATFESPAALVEVGVGEFSGSTTTAYHPYLEAVLPQEQTVELLDRAQNATKVNLLSVPKITFLNGQRASIQDLSQTPFVVGVEEVVGEFGKANQPIIAVLSSGRTLGARAVALESGEIELDLKLTSTLVEHVEEVRLPGERGVTVQAPRLAKSVIASKHTLEAGESLLVAPTVQPDQKTGRFQCCLVTATAIQPAKTAMTTRRLGAKLASR